MTNIEKAVLKNIIFVTNDGRELSVQELAQESVKVIAEIGAKAEAEINKATGSTSAFAKILNTKNVNETEKIRLGTCEELCQAAMDEAQKSEEIAKITEELKELYAIDRETKAAAIKELAKSDPTAFAKLISDKEKSLEKANK